MNAVTGGRFAYHTGSTSVCVFETVLFIRESDARKKNRKAEAEEAPEIQPAIAVMPERNANTCSLGKGWQEGWYDGKMGLIIFYNLYILKDSRIQ